MAKLPTIAAYAYKKSIGQPFIYPQNDLTYCENFLRMMFAVPSEPYAIDPDFVEALNLLLIVHADHEQNCSTSTVRMVGSSDANLFASISAGICALWGPLHGGANQACVEMLEAIRADGGDVNKYVDLAKDKNSGFRLMGFGHRVYKNYDPRATIIKSMCDKLLAKRQIDDPIFDIAQELEASGAERSVLHRAQAVSERRFLLRRDLSRDGHSGADVHGAVRHRPLARLDRPLDGNARTRRPRRSAARGRFTPAPWSATSCRWTSVASRSVARPAAAQHAGMHGRPACLLARPPRLPGWNTPIAQLRRLSA